MKTSHTNISRSKVNQKVEKTLERKKDLIQDNVGENVLFIPFQVGCPGFHALRQKGKAKREAKDQDVQVGLSRHLFNALGNLLIRRIKRSAGPARECGLDMPINAHHVGDNAQENNQHGSARY